MSFFMNSIPVPLRKNTAGTESVKMGNASVVTLPMQMHKGEPATPVVKMGDLVKVGTLVAKENGELSAIVFRVCGAGFTSDCYEGNCLSPIIR